VNHGAVKLVDKFALGNTHLPTAIDNVLRKVLPDQHLDAETKECVQFGMGVVATKGSYDTQRNDVSRLRPKLASLIERSRRTVRKQTTIEQYSATLSRRRFMQVARHKPHNTEVTPSAAEARTLYDSIQQLAPHPGFCQQQDREHGRLDLMRTFFSSESTPGNSQLRKSVNRARSRAMSRLQHSQITSTSQPAARSVRRCSLSRSLFRSLLRLQ
jgi:hypothetical protein